MSNSPDYVIDARVHEALGQYFNGVTLKKIAGDCSILTGIRKQNGAEVDIYVPNYTAGRDDASRDQIAKEFATYEKLNRRDLQAPVRLLTSRAFRKSPALAMLSCPVPALDHGFDARPIASRLNVYVAALEALAALHDAGIVHGGFSDKCLRREDPVSPIRICDMGFSGGRRTTVVDQPIAYQSCDVVNNSQPGLLDDVYAAGMLGYRILMGEHGPEQVLSGKPGPASPEIMTAAILGEARDAPSGEALFPLGHEKADQIAHVLARMIGRQATVAPYSSAKTALAALRSVIEGGDLPEEPKAKPKAVDTKKTVIDPASTVRGVGKATAVSLFGGSIIAMAAALYFHKEARTATAQNATLELRVQQFAEAERTRLDQEQASLNEVLNAAESLRQADVAVAEVRGGGGQAASSSSARFLEGAQAQTAAAKAAFNDRIWSDVTAISEEANTAAVSAAQAIAQVRQLAGEVRSIHAKARTAAEAAVGRPDVLPAKAERLGAEAEGAFANGNYEAAAGLWTQSNKVLEAYVRVFKGEADVARAAAKTLEVDTEGTEEAAFVRAKWLMKRAGLAYDAGAFLEAAAIYRRASHTFTKIETSDAPVANRDDSEREIIFGDNIEALEKAVALCQDFAVVPSLACPKTRPAGEAARVDTVTPYELDRAEVSMAKFATFVESTGYTTEAENSDKVIMHTSAGEAQITDAGYAWSAPDGKDTTFKTNPDMPVRNVSMNDAMAYCAWSGGRLPTEAEWEYAAGADSGHPFPWGDWEDGQASWRGASNAAMRRPLPVTSKAGATEVGHTAMSGGVREWVVAEDGPVLKGGSWMSVNPAELRIASRLPMASGAPGVDFGIRCAYDKETWK